MTPKEAYEARKVARLKERERREAYSDDREIDQLEIFDIADRFVTAIERIAEALDHRPPAS